MARIVQKYGGTSVGDVDRIKNVANRIKAFRDEIDSQAKGTTGLAAKIKELRTSIETAIAAPNSLGGAVKKVDTMDDYATFRVHNYAIAVAVAA